MTTPVPKEPARTKEVRPGRVKLSIAPVDNFGKSVDNFEQYGDNFWKTDYKGRSHWRKITHGLVEKQAIPVDNLGFPVEKSGCFGDNPAPFCGYSVQKNRSAREIPVDKCRYFVDNTKKYVDKNQVFLDNQPISPQISIETCGEA